MPDPITTAALIAAGSQIVSSGIGTLGASRAAKAQTVGAHATNAFNAAEAQKNRDFQERMYKHRHQYEVEDLLKAGLNPVLSAKYGGGSVPTGATATAYSNPQGHKLEQALGTARLVKEIGLISSQAYLNRSNAKKAEAEADKAKGEVMIPGFGRMPITEAVKLIKGVDGYNAKSIKDVDFSMANLRNNSRYNPAFNVGVKLLKKRKY